jgi:hypothetical protein
VFCFLLYAEITEQLLQSNVESTYALFKVSGSKNTPWKYFEVWNDTKADSKHQVEHVEGLQQQFQYESDDEDDAYNPSLEGNITQNINKPVSLAMSALDYRS